ncbi:MULTISPECIES: hypothetical protein [unclassified Kitasatospora]|uniref:hypothetical protein n=1 Tax=unclassified Kitasatospora TaxID=2633591 RepID=UPI001AE04C90|nr:hypothetical protein [Kitasatospora sp. RG8]MBP0451132.1 hypothetical protein [Kitasatospora sp. RG8]
MPQPHQQQGRPSDVGPTSHHGGDEAAATGARLWFRDGQVLLTPPAPGPRPDRARACTASLLSPGTELRRLRTGRPGETRAAGYMAMAASASGEVVLAPAPHGGWVDPTHADALGTAHGPLVAAAARFQLMAALGLGDLVPDPAGPPPVVLGSGPVALGAVLELLRRGAARVDVRSSRPWPAVAGLAGVRVVPAVADGSAGLVLECTGSRLAEALAAAAPGATVGLLGTPQDAAPLDPLLVHRSSLRVLGMHELGGRRAAERVARFREVGDWLAARFAPEQFADWCHVTPGDHAPELYRALLAGRRPQPPLLLLDWSAS